MAVPPISPFGIHHLAIQCFDLPAMARFYERVLRCKVERRWPSEHPEDHLADRSVWLKAGSSVIALERCDLQSDGLPWQNPQPGLHLLALEIPWQNRDVWIKHLHHCEVEIVFESAWTIYLRDPEGNRIGLSHFPFTADGQRSA